MKIARYTAIFLTVMFIGIVSIERLPGVLMATDIPYEYLMFGLFKISLLDDITHGVSGLLGLFALIAGYRWTVKFLMLVGGYYSLDALFFIIYGFVTGQGFVDNFLLNGPHILISVLVFYALLKSVKRLELNEKVLS
jgi:hypothetical protein